MSWNPQFALAVFVGLTASAEDLVRREIPNWIPVTAVVGGLGVSAWIDGWGGLGSSALGILTGFAGFLVFYMLGGMGGGDVKLMAGFGAILGTSGILEAALYTAAIGGALAFLSLLWRKTRKSAAGNPAKDPAYIPYAPAITLGGWMALVSAW